MSLGNEAFYSDAFLYFCTLEDVQKSVSCYITTLT